ncbi:MAG TPA: 4-carboxy-4-hydroxy-2-oxoadipate aldolase/oxaloacetate decarboxylase [Gaiellales bacterium]
MSDFAQLARLGVATVYEAAGRRGSIAIPLRRIVPGSRAAGPARTVRCGQGDNLMVHAAMAAVQPGDVLVLSMPRPEPVALLGDLLATQAHARGAAAVLVDGAVRDVDELEVLGLPVWARFVSVTGAAKEAVGAIDVPVTLAGQTIAPGDAVVLDGDGAAAVPRADIGGVLAAALAREQHEDQKRAQLQAGALSYDLDGLRARVEAGG